MGKLKPCPFCGGKAVLDHKYDRGIYQFSYVRCDNYMCRIEGKAFAVQPTYSADDYAIEFWNRRADNEDCSGGTGMAIGDDLSFAFLEGFEAGKWDMFVAITNAYHGKQYYFLQENNSEIKVYSRECGGYLTQEQAYLEFINRLREEG